MKTLGVEELKEHINEILRMVKEEGETIEVTDHGKAVARLVPVSEPQQSIKQTSDDVWAEIDRLAAEIGSYLPQQVDASEIMRDVRREL